MEGEHTKQIGPAYGVYWRRLFISALRTVCFWFLIWNGVLGLPSVVAWDELETWQGLQLARSHPGPGPGGLGRGRGHGGGPGRAP